MPIYDYRCDHCGHAFSAVQSFTDQTIDKCPNCGKRPRKLLVAPAVVFKGSGWYKTDSRGKAPKGSDSASESPKESESKSSSDHHGESRPAAKDSKSEAKETKTSPDTPKSGKSEEKS